MMVLPTTAEELIIMVTETFTVDGITVTVQAKNLFEACQLAGTEIVRIKNNS